MSILPFAFLNNIGPVQLLIVLVVLVLLFGPKKLPELSRAIGKSIGEFKKGQREMDKELEEADKTAQADPAEPVKEKTDSQV
jgi:sec-independent protein translocase protein TatA